MKPSTTLKAVPFEATKIEHGFWHDLQQLDADVSIWSIYEQFQETGRFDAMNCRWEEGKGPKPHIFWDSDIAKWCESAAYLLVRSRDPRLEEIVDEVVGAIREHQQPDGYFNSYYLAVEPQNRFTQRMNHELYCLGHWIEAAVAYDTATGKGEFLAFVERYVRLVDRVFRQEHSAAFVTPGHEEIELALMKLYRHTGKEQYRELCLYFLDHRGEDPDEQNADWINRLYAQDFLPVRQQRTAEGHAVRAMYLYCGMADAAYSCGDEAMAQACRALFKNAVGRRMYITGGIGSSSVGEAFTVDYDLPNREAYSESCAAIGLALFARRMQLLDRDSRYADVIERILYNGFRSSMSLDGTAFFYENPLEILPQFNHKDTSVRQGQKTRYPDTQRKRVFDCSCCPPNITRLIASVGDFLYTYEESPKTVYVHQYLDSSTRFVMAGVPVELKQTTRYPADGVVSLTASSSEPLGLALRIPGWCRGEADLSVDGVPQQLQMQNGYAAVELTGGTHQITLAFAMAPQLVECSPRVAANAGRAALTLGPVVYCLEGVDNGEDLRELAILRDTAYEISYSQEWGCNLIQASGVRRNAEAFEQAGELYRPLGSSPYLRQELRFIPYYAFANRGETEMVVWIQVR